MMYGFKHEFSVSHLKYASCFSLFRSVSDWIYNFRACQFLIKSPCSLEFQSVIWRKHLGWLILVRMLKVKNRYILLFMFTQFLLSCSNFCCFECTTVLTHYFKQALEFRKFWGEKSELRRFKDSRIAESTGEASIVAIHVFSWSSMTSVVFLSCWPR